ncbi:hypothetical protein SNE40_017025 [Patella caerulea]|uniref:Uncharacterized protein n=1 Tax=Patella caerulea TaxID=87958 RepID=A0AAN8PKQ3_PATCE
MKITAILLILTFISTFCLSSPVEESAEQNSFLVTYKGRDGSSSLHNILTGYPLFASGGRERRGFPSRRENEKVNENNSEQQQRRSKKHHRKWHQKTTANKHGFGNRGLRERLNQETSKGLNFRHFTDVGLELRHHHGKSGRSGVIPEGVSHRNLRARRSRSNSISSRPTIISRVYKPGNPEPIITRVLVLGDESRLDNSKLILEQPEFKVHYSLIPGASIDW